MKTATVQQGYKLQYWTPNSTNKWEKEHTKNLFPSGGHLNAHPVPLCFADFPSRCSPTSPPTELKIQWCFKTHRFFLWLYKEEVIIRRNNHRLRLADSAEFVACPSTPLPLLTDRDSRAQRKAGGSRKNRDLTFTLISANSRSTQVICDLNCVWGWEEEVNRVNQTETKINLFFTLTLTLLCTDEPTKNSRRFSPSKFW